jgi:hypothetical protein
MKIVLLLFSIAGLSLLNASIAAAMPGALSIYASSSLETRNLSTVLRGFPWRIESALCFKSVHV